MIKKSTLFLLSLMLAACLSMQGPRKTEIEQLKPGQYQIDPKHSSLIFKVGHMGLSSYVGRFNDFEASLDFNPEEVSQSKLYGRVKTASIDVNDSELEKELRKNSWFNVDDYPLAVFTSKHISAIKGNEMLITGDLTLLGKTSEVQLLSIFHGGAHNFLTGKYTIGFSATGRINRSDFGMDSYLAMVADEIEIELFAEFQLTKL